MLLHAINNGFVGFVLAVRYGFDNTLAAVTGQPLPADLVPRMQATADHSATAVKVIFYVALAAIAAAMYYWLRHQRQIIRYELAEEAQSGLISRRDWEVMPRYWARAQVYWDLVRAGNLERWSWIRRLHNELVDLALLKWRLRRVGGDPGQIERRRERIRQLRAQEPSLPA
jgi:hypothetical protein